MISHPVAVPSDIDDVEVVYQLVDESRLHDVAAEHASNILISYPYIRAPLSALFSPPDVLGQTWRSTRRTEGSR